MPKFLIIAAGSLIGSLISAYFLIAAILSNDGFAQEIVIRGVPYSQITLSSIALLFFSAVFLLPLVSRAKESRELNRFKKDIEASRKKPKDLN